jgi:hypothetical protein
VLPWPPCLDMAFNKLLNDLDWMIVDVGETSAATGVPAYIHGRFIPSLRLLRESTKARADLLPPMLFSLFGAQQVGYPKDVVTWRDEASLEMGVKARIAVIQEERQHIASAEAADSYFMSASLRKEAVFLSYSGQDRDFASDFIAALKSKFQQVFDYRNPDENPAGQSWMETIFNRLSTAPIGVALLSPSYFESGNCLHEGQQLMAAVDAKRLRFFPLKLHNEKFDMPPWMQNIQYLRLWEYPRPGLAVDAIIRQLDQRL